MHITASGSTVARSVDGEVLHDATCRATPVRVGSANTDPDAIQRRDEEILETARVRAFWRDQTADWNDWLDEVGGPDAVAAWQPDPITPDLDAEAWIAIGDPLAQSPGIGATPEAAVHHVNRWALATYADPSQAAQLHGAPEAGTPLSWLLWSPTAEEPSRRCALVHVRGSRASIDALVSALGGVA